MVKNPVNYVQISATSKGFVPILVLLGTFFIDLPFVYIRLPLVSRMLVLPLHISLTLYVYTHTWRLCPTPPTASTQKVGRKQKQLTCTSCTLHNQCYLSTKNVHFRNHCS